MININEKERLLTLANRVREISETSLNNERRQAWLAHHSLKGTRPMVLIEAQELVPLLGVRDRLVCDDSWARELESQLLERIWRFEELGDDAVVEPVVNCPWRVQVGDMGIALQEDQGASDHGGSKHWDPVISDLNSDLDKLHVRSLDVDREQSDAEMNEAVSIFSGILDVRRRNQFELGWSKGMTSIAIKLMGMEAFLMGMLDNPEGMHRLMSFLRDDQMHFIDRSVELGLLTLNNEDDYVGSGSLGYAPDLPGRDLVEGQPVDTKDMWVLSESQETVGVSPDMFGEFVFPYQHEIVKRFGLTYYGCCEPIDQRWQVIKQIENLRAVSISPWCDQAFMADALKRDYVFCRKQNPTMISTEKFDEDAVRKDLQETVDIACNSNLEIIMKDIHTLGGDSTRARRWVEIARETCKTEEM